MVVGDDVSEVDTLVVGGGPGGYTAALQSAGFGRSVALVERSRNLGGVCLNSGCIPSKSLIHIATLAGELKQAGDQGLDAAVTVDLARAQKWVGEIVGRLGRGIIGRLDSAGVEIVYGDLKFSDKNRAMVLGDNGPRQILFHETIIATGSRPVELPNLPFDGQRILDSGAALRLDQAPRHLAVVGGGYIGLELGTVFAKLGAHVTIVESASQLLPAFDASMVRAVSHRLVQLGVDLRIETVAEAVDADGLIVRGPDGPGHVLADQVIVAIGRQPNTSALGLDRLGVSTTKSGHLWVDAQMRAASKVFAVGDVTPGPPLAHRAIAQAEVAARSVSGLRSAFAPTAIPNVVYTDPEIVTVGLTAHEAADAGVEIIRLTQPLTASGRAATVGRSDGFIELVVAASDGTILGVHLVGTGVAELSGEACLAIEMGATADDLALTIHAHPTLSEGLRSAATGYRDALQKYVSTA